MPCIFCRSEDNLTDEHIFPAFMGGKLEVRRGSCERCNKEFGVAEGKLQKVTTPLLNLLQIKNRHKVVPSAPLNAHIRGMNLQTLPAFMDGDGEIILRDTVKTIEAEGGKTIQRGFFITQETSDKFVERARAKGRRVIRRGVPQEVVIEANYTLTHSFIYSLESRKVAAKIALAAIAYKHGIPFTLSPEFDSLRQARLATGDRDLRVWVFANEGFMGAHLHTAHMHSIMCYFSAGMRKAWAIVTLFGGITYLVDVATDYTEPESRQFSIFYDAATKKSVNPVVLYDEMTLIGHVLSPASKFEDRDAIDAQWYPIIARFCAEKGITAERIPRFNSSERTPERPSPAAAR